MLNVQSVAGNNVYKMNFKADDRRQYRQSQPIYVDRQQAEIERMQKEQKKQKRKSNILITVSIGAMLAIIIGTIFSVRSMKGGGAVDSINKVTLNWQDMRESTNKVASLTSPTTNKTLKEEFTKLIDNSNLSEKAKDWSGFNDSSELLFLYGYGGTGKTYVAQQYAQEIGALFTKIKYPDLGSVYKDGASIRVNNMFKEVTEFANKHPDRKIVLCIDEVDALIRKIDESSHGKEEASKVRSAVLTGIDELAQNTKNVKVVMTSNYHPECGVIDDVIKSRLNKNIEVKLPDKDQMKALFEMYLGKIKAIKPDFYKSREFDSFIDTMVKEGYSSREVEKISKEASSIFSSKLKGIPDDQIEKNKFMIEYLKKAKELKGQAASKTNDTMKVKKAA